MKPADILKFVQAPQHPVYLANVIELTRAGIESHEARLGLAKVFDLDEDVIQVHPDVVTQLRPTRGGV